MRQKKKKKKTQNGMLPLVTIAVSGKKQNPQDLSLLWALYVEENF